MSSSFSTMRYAKSPVGNGGSGRPRSASRAREAIPSHATTRSPVICSPFCKLTEDALASVALLLHASYLQRYDSILTIDLGHRGPKAELHAELLRLFEHFLLHIASMQIPDTRAELSFLPAFPIRLLCQNLAIRVAMNREGDWLCGVRLECICDSPSPERADCLRGLK